MQVFLSGMVTKYQTDCYQYLRGRDHSEVLIASVCLVPLLASVRLFHSWVTVLTKESRSHGRYNYLRVS